MPKFLYERNHRNKKQHFYQKTQVEKFNINDNDSFNDNYNFTNESKTKNIKSIIPEFFTTLNNNTKKGLPKASSSGITPVRL